MTSKKVVVQSETHGKAGRAWFRPVLALILVGFFVSIVPQAKAGFIYDFAPQSSFMLINSNADGTVVTGSNSLTLTGGNNLSLELGTTDYVATATSSGTVTFNYAYSSIDAPMFDFAGYLVNGNLTVLADTDGESGMSSFGVVTGETFGFRVETVDNSGGPGVLTVSSTSSAVPEPSTTPVLLLLAVGGLLLTPMRRILRGAVPWAAGALAVFGQAVFGAPVNNVYAGTNITGQVVLSGPQVNLLNLSQQVHVTTASPALELQLSREAHTHQRLLPPQAPLSPAAEMRPGTPAQSTLTVLHDLSVEGALRAAAARSQLLARSESVAPASKTFGFNGLTHLDQRNANNGNQYSVEPPNPSIAVGNGFILQGVNNAVQVYSSAGTPLLPAVLASNQVFGVAPAINRSTNISGVFPTDMRVFYDPGIDRWFILQRAQCCNSAGNNINTSQIYIAVSQTGDPTGTYNNYFINTTDSKQAGCTYGCVADSPQIGADQYGLYISSNQYPIGTDGNPSLYPLGATILAISKTALASAAASPTAYQFILPSSTGLEFAISPAITPPGGSFSVGLGGVQFFVSSYSTGGSTLALWAISNTSSLSTSNPSLTLNQAFIPTQFYTTPPNASQESGPLPYGSTLGASEAFIDSSDCRILSVAIGAGRLYTSFDALVTDDNGKYLAGIAYFVLNPTFRGGVLAATVLNQGFIVTNNNHLIKSAFGVNAQGNGALAFTLTGPNYYPSAAFVPVTGLSPGSAIQLAAAGAAPEDGFTGYEQAVARWGDYASAVTGSDGSIWMVTEYIPNLPRTQFANWGTFVMQYTP